MNIPSYLSRIHYTGPLTPTLSTLRHLQLAHLLAVPFENLSIHWGQPIVLEEAALFQKIVTQRRGGFCYELNGLFAGLLHALGYPVQMLSAGVYGSGVFGPDFDHMALLVRLEADYWLVDVGFGDSFRQPLSITADLPQDGGDGHLYRLTADPEQSTRWVLAQQTAEGDWHPQYRFTLQPHTFPDYAAMCHYHQTSAESPFTQKRVCTIATPHGRYTLSHNTLITTDHGRRTERPLADEAEVGVVLRDLFGIVR